MPESGWNVWRFQQLAANREFLTAINSNETFPSIGDALQQQVEATFQDKRFLLRSQLSGEASAALRAAGVGAPPTLRELP